jgi:hypothetical protein
MRHLLAAALILFIALGTLRPAALGFEPRLRHLLVPIRSNPEAIEFFRELERLGNSGPILELPMAWQQTHSLAVAPPRILLSAYHRRRTSSCYGSFPFFRRKGIQDLVVRLPDREALVELGNLGFTTIVVHHPGAPRRLRDPLERAASEPHPLLRRLHGTPSMTAYAIGTGAVGATPTADRPAFPGSGDTLPRE